MRSSKLFICIAGEKYTKAICSERIVTILETFQNKNLPNKVRNIPDLYYSIKNKDILTIFFIMF